MKRLPLFFPITLLLFLSSCGVWNSYKRQQSITGVRLLNAPIRDTISYQNTLGLMIVYVKINHHPRPLKFIFDTGANLTVINANTAAELGLLPTDSLQISDSQGASSFLPTVKLDTLQLGNGYYSDVLAAIMAFPENNLISCIAQDGILGYHVIRQLEWSIHPGDTIMIGSSTPSYESNQLTEISLKGKKAPVITVQLEQEAYKNVLFDTGSNGGLDLAIEELKNHRNLETIKRVDGNSQGLYGNRLDTIQKVYNTEVTLGDRVVRSNVDFEKRSETKLGMLNLQNYHLIIDGPREKLLIGEVETPQELASTFGFVPGMNEHGFYVSSIDLGGQAEEQGLQLNQPLLSINGIRASDLKDLSCGYFQFILYLQEWNKPILVEYGKGERLIMNRRFPVGLTQ